MIERSSLLEELGVLHGFTTRHGGVSRGRFASLNMGGKWGDEPDAVTENHRRVSQAAGFSATSVRMVRQVHGAAVARAIAVGPDTEADALWTHRDDGSAVAAVLTADCVPVLLADRGRTVACAVHSGWKGTVAGIAGAAVESLRSAGVEPDDLMAAIGPCIELAAFEVGPEVAAQFDPRFVDTVAFDKPHVDLVACVRQQLLSAGVPSKAIERIGRCTYAHPDDYFSYRRDGSGIGQMMSFVSVSPPSAAAGGSSRRAG